VCEARKVVELAIELELGPLGCILSQDLERKNTAAGDVRDLVRFSDFSATKAGKHLITVSNQL